MAADFVRWEPAEAGALADLPPLPVVGAVLRDRSGRPVGVGIRI